MPKDGFVISKGSVSGMKSSSNIRETYPRVTTSPLAVVTIRSCRPSCSNDSGEVYTLVPSGYTCGQPTSPLATNKISAMKPWGASLVWISFCCECVLLLFLFFLVFVFSLNENGCFQESYLTTFSRLKFEALPRNY